MADDGIPHQLYCYPDRGAHEHDRGQTLPSFYTTNTIERRAGLCTLFHRLRSCCTIRCGTALRWTAPPAAISSYHLVRTALRRSRTQGGCGLASPSGAACAARVLVLCPPAAFVPHLRVRHALRWRAEHSELRSGCPGGGRNCGSVLWPAYVSISFPPSCICLTLWCGERCGRFGK